MRARKVFAHNFVSFLALQHPEQEAPMNTEEVEEEVVDVQPRRGVYLPLPPFISSAVWSCNPSLYSLSYHELDEVFVLFTNKTISKRKNRIYKHGNNHILHMKE